MSVQVTDNDIVFFGHGSYQGGGKNMRLPQNIDLYILQPVGYTLKTEVASALIQQSEIKKLTLHYNDSNSIPVEPPFAVYTGGSFAPDFTLYEFGSLIEWGKMTIGDKKNVVTVNQDTLQSELIISDVKIREAMKKLPKGKKLKLYWSACANQVREHYVSL